MKGSAQNNSQIASHSTEEAASSHAKDGPRLQVSPGMPETAPVDAIVVSKIGEGAYGKVFRVLNQLDGGFLAMKCIDVNLES